MPRPRSLTHDQIAAAALAVIDRDGLAGLSMRAVGSELHMSTMALYRYVQDREQLEGLVVAGVLAAAELTTPPDAPWTERLTLLVERVRAAVAAHPSVVPLLLLHRHDSAASLGWGEAMLGVLTEAGFAGVQRVVAFRCMLSYLIGALQVEHFGPLSGAGTVAIAQLPSADYPNLAATARDAGSVPPQQEFGQGFAILLRGLESGRHGADAGA
jgi:AcrR family transcriptional regulator